eukprot:CAMPEP_0170373526 /NCGR_PEP_ID=MMETSP0117_2-20130122/10115_1 /TAXON_ID=400756 /ORGANISM="Durinskia baltica, Strain CSIRO CS-38" /LENGTH=117 /DNA_ID=CAMNT_0010628421 /DNA_START=27 /DNA_END=378 /DNA_ORIENTATION=+
MRHAGACKARPVVAPECMSALARRKPRGQREKAGPRTKATRNKRGPRLMNFFGRNTCARERIRLQAHPVVFRDHHLAAYVPELHGTATTSTPTGDQESSRPALTFAICGGHGQRRQP